MGQPPAGHTSPRPPPAGGLYVQFVLPQDEAEIWDGWTIVGADRRARDDGPRCNE